MPMLGLPELLASALTFPLPLPKEASIILSGKVDFRCLTVAVAYPVRVIDTATSISQRETL